MTARSQTVRTQGAGGFTSALRRWGRGANRAWRIVRTALAFALAGVMSLVVGIILLPVIRLSSGRGASGRGASGRGASGRGASGRGELGELRSQKIVHGFARAFVRTLQLLRVMRFESVGADRLRRPGILIVANHPTLIDGIVLMSLMPQADCVVKASHYQNPFLGAAVKGAGYIPNLDGPNLTEECARRLGRGRSVIIFPEGTRSPVGGLGSFARGAAHVALRADSDPIPVTIECQPATLYHGSAWWNVPEHGFTYTVTVDEPLPIKDALPDDLPAGPAARPRQARALTRALQNYFERRVVVA